MGQVQKKESAVQLNWRIAVALVVSLTWLSGLSVAAEPARKDIELPKDPKAAVITLDVSTMRGEPMPPILVIQADGTMVASGKAYGKLEARDLQDLLHFIIEENKFLDLPKFVERKVRRSEAEIQIIKINAAGKKHEVNCVGSFKKDSAGLKQFQAVHERIRKAEPSKKQGG